MKFVVYLQGGGSELVEAASIPHAVSITAGAESARIAHYIDRVRFGDEKSKDEIRKEKREAEEENPPESK